MRMLHTDDVVPCQKVTISDPPGVSLITTASIVTNDVLHLQQAQN
jgi:hypothetical protein